MKFPARILFAILIVVFQFVTPSFAYAQTASTYSSLVNVEPNVPVTINTLTQGVFLGLLSTTTCLLVNVDFFNASHQCLSYNAKTQKFGYSSQQGQGMIGMATGGLSLLFTSPFHTSDYIQYLSSNFGLVKKAHASSSGYSQLSPVVNLWIAFRNVAYIFFVIVFVVIGFAIMVRAKIDPRTVMTIENQLPKLIVGLVLITFSFAIAGLLIDVMWLAVYLIINLFASLDPQLKSQLGSLTTSVTSSPFGWANSISGSGGFLGIASQAAGGVKGIAQYMAGNVPSHLGGFSWIFYLVFAIPTFISCAIQGVGNAVLPWHPGQDFGTCMNSGVAGLFGDIFGVIAFIIFAVAIFVALAKVWWSLLKAYSLFLIYVIFGPIMIMAGVIPGSKTNFENWIRHLLAYLIVFPTVIAIFLLGKVMMDLYSSHSGDAFVPPLIGVDQTTVSLLGPLLGFAIIMLAPQALQMVQDALNAPDLKYLPGIGQSIGVGAKYYGNAAGSAWNRFFREYDPMHGREEGMGRRLVFGDRGNRNFIGKIFYGREVGEGAGSIGKTKTGGTEISS